ncbi:ISAs1 family transposase [Marinomonas arctica]|uniref:ISAs1 family transposase n=7 Tax=Marinomonas TaxID=28253 RepID=A0A7H1JCB6_9GAMM|nr:ISAs1 family transposase [Marinomonas arctica]QNT07985.1 ISAs1 family transposase [Marinomonas arctica]QNT08132.1 ISAs1 family transposase [Marinomonas arctica]
MDIDAFSQHFKDIQDPRQTAKITYSLFDVLFLSICSVISGASGWEDIEDFGEAHCLWLQEKGLFPQGVPTHDTIARIISRLNTTQFRQCFIGWAKSVSKRTFGEVIAIDGKTLRSSYNRENRQSAIHMVSAFATQNGVVMGQIKTEEKSNEITAIPALLRLLDIKGCLVSIDAMGCQKDIAKQIVTQKGDYLLAVKGNQDALHRAVKQALAESISLPVDPKQIQITQGHGRYEAREYKVLPATALIGEFKEWTGLKTIGVAMGYRFEKKAQQYSLEYRYYISSAELDTSRFAEAVRGHWGIENSLHWVLDVSMNEDKCPIYNGESAEILATMRHFALNMLRAETSKKASIRRKQKIASMDIKYLDKVLAAGLKAVAEE